MTKEKDTTQQAAERAFLNAVSRGAAHYSDNADVLSSELKAAQLRRKAATELANSASKGEVVKLVEIFLRPWVRDPKKLGTALNAVQDAISEPNRLWPPSGSSSPRAMAVCYVRWALASIDQKREETDWFAADLIENLTECHSGFARLTVESVSRELLKRGSTRPNQAPETILRNLADTATTETGDIWPESDGPALKQAYKDAFRREK